MIVTIVIFMAFDKVCNESFIKGETMEQIHQKLMSLCNTYVPVSILQADEAEFLSLNQLDRFNEVWETTTTFKNL